MLSPSSSKSVSMVTCEGLEEIIFSTISSKGFPEIVMMLEKPRALKAFLSFIPSTTIKPSSFFNFSRVSKIRGESIII